MAGPGCSGGGSDGATSGRTGRGRSALDGAPPSAPPQPAADEQQGGFANPPTNMGAFVQRIPIEVPPGIGAMTPDVALAYSSQGGVGVAGVGWDIPTPMITLNQADGMRPAMVRDDIMRFPPRTPVERYSSNFGTMAQVRQPGPYATAPKTYLFTAHADARIHPIRDERGRPELRGEKAAWEVTMKDGTRYRYGYFDDSSLFRDEGTDVQTKVAWMLDLVEDRHGNRMHYYYEKFPGGQDTFLHPVLRAIEYGVPASNQSTQRRMVVLFDYLESPWKKASYALGTRTDFAFLLDRACVFAVASVQAGTTPGGHRSWDIPGSDAPSPTDNDPFTKTGCWELTYQFEDPATYADSYTGRPLLVKVQQLAHDGSALPPWKFAYRHQGTRWQDVYQASIDAGGTEWDVSNDSFIERSSLDVEQRMIDLNGDGLADFLGGKSDGSFDVQLASPGRAAGPDYEHTTWPNPLAVHATPADLLVTDLETVGESSASDIWYSFNATLAWEAGPGLGFARAMTAAPALLAEIFAFHIPGNDRQWSEAEDLNEPLGLFQFLHSSYTAPHPAVGMRSLTERADTIDQLETFGSYKDRVAKEAAFDLRTSDGEDRGDDVEFDQCWSVGSGPTSGALGADLRCFDDPGGRWFAAAGVLDGRERGYSTDVWTQQDMDGDGLVDLVFAAPVIVRDANGVVRDAAGGHNDWYWAPGTGHGWQAPRPWVVPRKSPGLPEVGAVQGTGMLGVSVSDSELRANRVFGGGVMLNVGLSGWSVSPTIITTGGAVGLPGIGPGTFTLQGLQSMPSAAALAGFSTFTSAVGGGSSVGAAAQSIHAVTASGDIRSAMPSIGIGLNVTNKGPQIPIDLPLLGDIVIKFDNDPVLSQSYGYQSMVDMTGDGRPDLVSSRFMTPTGAVNPASQWLLYRNNGESFEKPEVMRFATTPITAAGSNIGLPPIIMSSMARSVTSNYTDTLSWLPPAGWTQFPIGVNQQEWGLADVNGDGLPDLVDSTNQLCQDPSSGVLEACWTVYFSLGREFSAPIQWRFQGNWQAQHGGECDLVYASPKLSRVVYGQTSDDDIFGGPLILVESRQVQGLADVNGDGLSDFVYEKPAPVNGADDSECDYIRESTNFSSTDEIQARVSPFRLHRELLVRLNDGNGFGPPVRWVDDSGRALAGAMVSGTGATPLDKHSYTVLGVGDFDADGAPDLSERWDPDWSWWGWGPNVSRLFKLGEANVDVLSSMQLPQGGRIEVSYDYQETNPHMAGGHWAVSSVRMVDLDEGRLDVTRTYHYEGGKYDRERRTFQGFERVYQVTQGASGYTLSRYYQSPGLEGQLYCRAVRRLEGAGDAVAALAATHQDEWDDTPLGGSRPGWVPPVAIGDADHAGELGGPRPPTGDVEDLAGGPDVPEGSDDSYGPPPTTDPGEDAVEEAAEEDRYDNDESTTPPVEVPEWLSPLSADASIAGSLMPRDVTQPVSEWEAEDATLPPWWEWPVYSDDCEPGTGPGANFLCEPGDVNLSQLACGDADDPGVLVQEEFSVMADLSTLVGIHTVRPQVESTRLYDAAGGNPLVTASDRVYDGLGNVTRLRDLGDVATAQDDLITTTVFQAPHVAHHVLDKPCSVTVEDGTGRDLGRMRNAYDNPILFDCTTPVATGNVTTVERVVDAVRFTRETFHYTAEGLVDVRTDPRNHATTTTYDPNFPWYPVREERTVVNAGGPTTIATEKRWLGVNHPSLTLFGPLGQEIDANGDVTTHTYDSFNRPLKLIRPGDSTGSPTESWSYHDWNGNPTDRTRVVHTRRFSAALSVATTSTVDGFGLVERVEGPPPDNLAGCVAGCVAVAREAVYDADGRVTESRHPYFSNDTAEPDLTRTTYDLLGRVTQVTGPNDAATVTTYDRDLTTVTDPDQLVTVTRSDARGNPIGVYRYADSGASLYSATESTYRADGLLEGMVDDAGNVWSFAYDQLGQQTMASDPNTGVRNTIYDDSGNVAVVTDERYATTGMAMGIAYDALDRPILREVRRGTTVVGTTLSGGTPIERTFYWYDVDPATFPDHVASCPENHLGRLTRVVQWQLVGDVMADVSRKEFCYDDRGRVGKMAHIINGQDYSFVYTYGSADQSITTMFPDEDVVTNEYDASGRLARVRNTAGPLVAASHARADGLPVRRELGSGAAKQRFCYEDGPASAILSRMVVGSSSMSFGCANAAPPVAGSIYDVSYTRTPGGRIMTRSEMFVRPGSGAEAHETSYDYDGVFRLESEDHDGVVSLFDYDTLDNLTEIGGQAQGFGAAGRAVRGAGPNALLDGAGGRTFSYDAIGNALSMTLGGSTTGFVRGFDGQPLTVVRGSNLADWSIYYYDEGGRRVMRAHDGVGKVYAGPFHDDGTRTESFYPGIGVKVGSQQYFTVGDPAGSTALMLDAAGNPVQYAAYEPYGGIRANDRFDPDPNDGLTPYDTDYLFGGKERDDSFGAADDIYDYGPRMYLADVGTWLQADPTYDDGPNRYTFVHGDPINRADPSGFGGVEPDLACSSGSDCLGKMAPHLDAQTQAKVEAAMRKAAAKQPTTAVELEMFHESVLRWEYGIAAGPAGQLKAAIEAKGQGANRTEIEGTVEFGFGGTVGRYGVRASTESEPPSPYMTIFPASGLAAGRGTIINWPRVVWDWWHSQGAFEKPPRPLPDLVNCDIQDCAYSARPR